VAKRKAFALRISPRVYDAVARWAADELRSVNGQIEYLLTAALRDAGRLRAPPSVSGSLPAAGSDGDVEDR